MTQTPSLWSKIALALLPVVLAGLIAYGALTARVANTAAAMDSKASRELVETQYHSILQRLDAIDRRLERMNP